MIYGESLSLQVSGSGESDFANPGLPLLTNPSVRWMLMIFPPPPPGPVHAATA